jgi:hypothetical protein
VSGAYAPVVLTYAPSYTVISGVTPELWQSKPFGARKDLCAPFFLSSQWSHLIAKNASNYPKCQTLPSFNLWGHTKFVCWSHISWVMRDNRKLVYFLVNSSHLYALSRKFISRITLSFRFNLTSHAKYIVLCGVSHLVIKILSEVSHAFGDKGWSQSPKFEHRSNKWKSVT